MMARAPPLPLREREGLEPHTLLPAARLERRHVRASCSVPELHPISHTPVGELIDFAPLLGVVERDCARIGDQIPLL